MRSILLSLTFIMVALVISCSRSDDRKALEVLLPCGSCPDKMMKCVSNECQCPEGYYKFGRFCEEKTENTFMTSFKNTPFDCKESGTIDMPELNVEFTDNYGFVIRFKDGSVAQSTDARYYKNPEYELVTDQYLWLPGPSGICNGNGVIHASIAAKRNIGSDEVSAFLTAYGPTKDDMDTFTVVFRK